MKSRLSWKKSSTVPPLELKVLWLRETLDKESPEIFLFSAYEILTDEVPRRSVGEDFLPPSYFCPYLPQELDHFILQGLKKRESFSSAKMDRFLLDWLQQQGNLGDKILEYWHGDNEEFFNNFLLLKRKNLLSRLEKILCRMEEGKEFIQQDLHRLLVEYKDVFSVDEALQKIYERLAFYQIDRSLQLRQKRKKKWVILTGLFLTFILLITLILT